MSFKPEPVQRPRDQVEKQLREAIMTSVFSRGDRLPSEAELSRAFQVSRATVREALRALVSEGLVTKSPGAGGGTFVETVDHEALQTMLSGSLDRILKLGSVSLSEVAAVRQMLEIPAARLAATNRTEEQADELRRLLKCQEVTRERRDEDHPRDPQFFEFCVALYNLVAAATGNRLLQSFVSAITRVTVPLYMRDLDPDDTKVALGHCRSLVTAICDRDPDAAEAAMAAQLAAMAELLELPAEPQAPSNGTLGQ